MKIYLGETGLDQSWQAEFPKTTECHKCKGEARIMFVGQENRGEKEFISKLHKNEGKGGYWFHDAIAVAVYLCKECF